MGASLFDLPRRNAVPAEWASRSLRSILKPRSERNQPDLPLLTVARERGVFVRTPDDDNHNAIPEDLSNYKVARSGDLVINKMKAWQGSLGLAPVDGIVSPAYFVFQADFAVPQFGEYLLRSKPYVSKFGAASDGVRVGQWDLSIARMRDIAVCIPPPTEQSAIVKYLAHANGRISRAIAAKHRTISLIQEQQAAKARSLLLCTSDGEPANWRYVPAKRLCKITTGFEDSGNADPDGEYPFFVRGREVLRSNDYLMDTEAVMTPGDGQGGVGKVFHYYDGKFQAHQRLYVFSEFRGVDGRFFYWFLASFFRRFALSQSNTVTMESLRRPVLAAFPVAVPPAREQQRIVGRIEAENARAGAAMLIAQREIELLKEFRDRLIADVVTGKISVVEVSASLLEPEAATTDSGLAPSSEDRGG